MLVLRAARATRQARRAHRAIHTSVILQKDDFKLKDLQAAFLNPASPFYLDQSKGEVGPASPDDHTVSRPLPGQQVEYTPPPFAAAENTPLLPHMSRVYDRNRATGHEWFDSNGFDTEGRIEWPCAWGDSDMFQHINNVAYCRYVESSRMRWLETLVPELGKEGEDLVAGRHTSIVLKEINLRYRAPMTYPDAIIIAVRPHSIDQERGQFKLAHAGWSLKDNQLTITGDSTCTMYDFDTLKKGKMSDLIKNALEKRAGI